MLRYKRLLMEKLEPSESGQKPMQLRELARTLQIPVPSLHNYVQFDTLPRIENIQKISRYFGESIASMFSEDDDTTAGLIEAIRKLPTARKEQLLKEITQCP